MLQQITPCLWFDAQAPEAGALYCSVFNNAKIVAQSPYVTEIEVGEQRITLLDGGPKFKPNASISLFYICETEEEINRIYQQFSDGAEILMPLDKYEWSEKYVWLNDKFGVSWQFALGKIEDVGQKITPCFTFVGRQYGMAEDAINFYCTVFKEHKIDGILRYGKNEPPDIEGKVKHSQIAFNGQKFMFMESAEQYNFSFTEGVSLVINCETQEEIDYYWSKLTEKGEESMCGWLKDKFGVWWQITPIILNEIMNDPNKAGKAAQAFMEMRKLDIEKIVQATMK